MKPPVQVVKNSVVVRQLFDADPEVLSFLDFIRIVT